MLVRWQKLSARKRVLVTSYMGEPLSNMSDGTKAVFGVFYIDPKDPQYKGK